MQGSDQTTRHPGAARRHARTSGFETTWAGPTGCPPCEPPGPAAARRLVGPAALAIAAAIAWMSGAYDDRARRLARDLARALEGLADRGALAVLDGRVRAQADSLARAVERRDELNTLRLELESRRRGLVEGLRALRREAPDSPASGRGGHPSASPQALAWAVREVELIEEECLALAAEIESVDLALAEARARHQASRTERDLAVIEARRGDLRGAIAELDDGP